MKDTGHKAVHLHDTISPLFLQQDYIVLAVVRADTVNLRGNG